MENALRLKSKSASRWDNQPGEAKLAYLDEAKVKAFVERAKLSWDSLHNALQKLELLQGGQLLNAAMVFFARRPVVKLRCAVFASAASATIMD